MSKEFRTQYAKKTIEMGNDEILGLGIVRSIRERRGQEEAYFKAVEKKPRTLIEARRKTENEGQLF